MHKFDQIVIFFSDNTVVIHHNDPKNPLCFVAYKNEEGLDPMKLTKLMNEFNQSKPTEDTENLDKDKESDDYKLEYEKKVAIYNVAKYEMEDELSLIINVYYERSIDMITQWFDCFVSINKIIDINTNRLSLLIVEIRTLSGILSIKNKKLADTLKEDQNLNKSLEEVHYIN